MSGSHRKRKSLWDSKEDDLPPNHVSEKNSYHEKDRYSSLHGGRDSKWAEADDELVSKDARWSSSGQPIGSSYRDDGRDFNDIPQTRRVPDGDKRYHVSPSFDGQRPQSNSRSPQNNMNHSRRFRRSRSRSQSRSDSRGQGRSRSRDMSRDRIRGRSSDRGRVRGRSRSRSPQGDYRREPHGYNDRRSGSGLSSQPCRDFAAGDCRRGSQCRFLHQKNLNDRDGGRLETNQSERWRRPEQGNYYDGENDVPSKNNYKSTTVCNDFQKGRCSRGSQCRFLHDDGFGDRIERSSRNTPFEKDYKQHSRRSDIPLCKFFMMGRCQRDNCRFSHDAQVRGDQNDRRGPESEDINKSWKGPTWDDESLAISGNTQSTGWDNYGNEPPSYQTSERHAGDRWDHTSDDTKNQSYDPKRVDEAIVLGSARSTGWGNNDDVENFKVTNMISSEKCSDNRWGHKSNDDSAVYGDPSSKNKAAEGNENMSPGLGTGGAANEVVAGSVNVEKSFDRKDLTLTSREETRMQEASNQVPAPPVMHHVFPDYSQFQQHPNNMGTNNAIPDYSSSANGVQIYGNVSYPALVHGQNGSQISDSFSTPASGFGGINQSQTTTFANPSVIHGNDLYETVQNPFSASNQQNQTQMHHEEPSRATMTSGMPQKTVNSEQVSPLANIESLKQIQDNLPQLMAVLNSTNSAEVAPPVPDSAGLVLSFTPTNAQTAPAAVAQKQYDPIGDSIEPHKLGNHNQPLQVLSNSVEHVNEVVLEPSAPPSSAAVALDAGKINNSGFPGDNNKNNEKDPKLGKDKPVANLVPEANTEGPAETHKQEQVKPSVKKLDADAKNGDASNGKDEKTIRLFKVALVEFVKELLKPKWKEGHMSRDVHKTIVKKVVDKVTSTIQGPSIPKTQEKIDQYLSYSKPKLSKLVEAYAERFSKSSS